MNGFSRKEYLQLNRPTASLAVSDQRRIELALEGYISKFGMRAEPGAVDSVKIEGGSLKITTIAGAAPRGICGSGIIELLAHARALAENIYCVQFASIPDFLIRMQAAKFIPHTDLSRFPSVSN